MGPGAKIPLNQLHASAQHWHSLTQLREDTTSLQAFRSRIRQGLNCIEGPMGDHADPAAGNPCEGLGTPDIPLGIIPALARRVAEHDPYAEDALAVALQARQLAVRALHETDIRQVQRHAHTIALLLQAALSMYP